MRYLVTKCHVALLTIIIFCAGCKKWLDKPADTVIGTPTSLSDLIALMNNKENMNYRTPFLGEASSDSWLNIPVPFDDYKGLYTWTLLPREIQDGFGVNWQSAYHPVYIANLCLDMLNKIPRTSANASDWDLVKGRAHFFRAYYFSQIAWTWANAYGPTSVSDLGIPLKQTSNIYEPTIRSTVKETYEQIIADALMAVNYLTPLSDHALHPSRAAAFGLLARTHLSMGNYAEALKFADSSLSINQSLINFNGDPDIVTNFSGSSFPFKQYNKETIFYSQYTDGSSGAYFVFYQVVDTTVIKSYAANDLRLQAFFYPYGTTNYKLFKGNYSQTMHMGFTGITTAEMLLTRAECYARGGNKDAALTDLNHLLANRIKNSSFSPVTATTAIEVVDRILLERHKELLFRGLRWMDIKRLNRQGKNIILRHKSDNIWYELLPNGNRYALPLPQDIVNLTGIPQNPF